MSVQEVLHCHQCRLNYVLHWWQCSRNASLHWYQCNNVSTLHWCQCNARVAALLSVQHLLCCTVVVSAADMMLHWQQCSIAATLHTESATSAGRCTFKSTTTTVALGTVQQYCCTIPSATAATLHWCQCNVLQTLHWHQCNVVSAKRAVVNTTAPSAEATYGGSLNLRVRATSHR